MARLPELRVAALDERQRAVYSLVKREAREFVQGPIRALLLSPDMAEQIQAFGRYEHNLAVFEPRLKELAVLIAARAWTSQYEWYIHAPLARKEGISDAVIDAIRNRTQPHFEREDEKIVYTVSHELLKNHRLSQPLYDLAVKAFGESGLAELVGLLGYFVVLAMMINSFELGIPKGETPPLTD